jgi:hypothetical protein
MKKVFYVVLGLFAFQNAFSKDILECERPAILYNGTCTIRYEDSTTTRYVLWRVYTDSIYKQTKVKVDSVFREDFYTKEKWNLRYIKRESPNTTSKTYAEKLNLTPNVRYLVLATANCSYKMSIEETCNLYLIETYNVLTDTPENREFLSKKRDGAKIVYERKSRGGIGNIDETSTRKKKPDVEK